MRMTQVRLAITALALGAMASTSILPAAAAQRYPATTQVQKGSTKIVNRGVSNRRFAQRQAGFRQNNYRQNGFRQNGYRQYGYNRRNNRGFRGGAVIGGIVASVLIASAIRESRAGSSDLSQCEERYRSFDPRTGTYMGYDGERHVCPYLD